MEDILTMKKTLATRLIERTNTIEFRAIKKQLYIIAQNRGNCYLTLRISPEAITQLQNECLTVEQITEHGYEKWKVSW